MDDDTDKSALERLAEVLQAHGVEFVVAFVIDARSLALGSNFTLTTRVGDLDLLGNLEPLGD
jgi:hypothetical protein